MITVKSALILALSLKGALAANVHFNCDEASDGACTINPFSTLFDSGYGILVEGSVSGLGGVSNNGQIDFFMEADGEGEGMCINRGRTAAPGQNPVLTNSANDSVNESMFQSGNAPFSLEAIPDTTNNCCLLGDGSCVVNNDVCAGCPSCQLPEETETCPNGKNWNQFVMGVTWNRIVIDAVLYDDGLKEVQRMDCFIGPTEDGTVSVTAADCITCELCRATGHDVCADYTTDNYDSISDGCN